MSSQQKPNELRPDLLSTTSLHPWPGMISSPRLQMFNSQMSQALAVNDSTDRRCFTGMEPKFGDLTFSVRMPHDARVIKSVQRYPRTMGDGNIAKNPETVLIYEYDRPDMTTGRYRKEVSYISLPSHHSIHTQFGYRYNYNNSIGEYIGAGEKIADSPNVSDDGNYRFGLEANVAMMSVPQIIEDGVMVSESFCERMKTTAVETYEVSFGKYKHPLNLYGDDSHYQIHPEVDQCVGQDGILLALREYDDLMAPINLSKAGLQTIDSKYDECVFVEPGARVVDVRVTHDTRVNVVRGKNVKTPHGMTEQPEKYRNAEEIFYTNILNEYRRLRNERGAAFQISPKFHRLLVEAMAATATGDKRKMSRTYRGTPIDEWRLEITIEYPIVPTIGYKLSGCHGDKGVICDIRPDEEMPVDADGNRTEIVMDGLSTIKRMNVSRLMEQYINACSREVTKNVKEMVANPETYTREDVENYLLGYYNIVSPRMPEMVTDEKGRLDPDHISSIVNDRLGVKVWIPTDNEPQSMDIIDQLQRHYAPVFGPVTYRGMSGEWVTTETPVLVGSMYVMLLEKTGRNWAGVSSSKLSHFGVPAKLTMMDRYATPGRSQPIRFGESETRLFAAFVGGQATADLLDRTNNPEVRREVQENVLRSNQPTALSQAVDRSKFPAGQSRILSMIRHLNECAGLRFKKEIKHDED